MKTPPMYEKMITEIAKAVSKYGFSYRDDTLKDEPPLELGQEHHFDINIHITGYGKDTTVISA